MTYVLLWSSVLANIFGEADAEEAEAWLLELEADYMILCDN